MPTSFREVVWKLAHATPAGGHLGQDKIIAKVTRWFHWPGLGDEIAHRCAACTECQKVNDT